MLSQDEKHRSYRSDLWSPPGSGSCMHGISNENLYAAEDFLYYVSGIDEELGFDGRLRDDTLNKIHIMRYAHPFPTKASDYNYWNADFEDKLKRLERKTRKLYDSGEIPEITDDEFGAHELAGTLGDEAKKQEMRSMVSPFHFPMELGEIGYSDEWILMALENMILDRAGEARTYALKVIGMIRDPMFIPLLERMYEGKVRNRGNYQILTERYGLVDLFVVHRIEAGRHMLQIVGEEKAIKLSKNPREFEMFTRGTLGVNGEEIRKELNEMLEEAGHERILWTF